MLTYDSCKMNERFFVQGLVHGVTMAGQFKPPWKYTDRLQHESKVDVLMLKYNLSFNTLRQCYLTVCHWHLFKNSRNRKQTNKKQFKC